MAGRGAGRSKKESQQDASKEALTRMRRDAKNVRQLVPRQGKTYGYGGRRIVCIAQIDVIEQSLTQTTKTKNRRKKHRNRKWCLKKKPANYAAIDSDAAYDAAYDENADFEVIDTPPVEHELTPEGLSVQGIAAATA